MSCAQASDCEDWVGTGRGGQTGVLTEWTKFVRNQKRLQRPAHQAKLVCIDLQPYTTTQAPDREEILKIGGFSDADFGVVAGFLVKEANRFVTEVEEVEV